MVVEHAHGLRQRRGPNAKSSLHKAHLAPDAGLQAPGASLSFAQGSHDFESLDRGIGRGDRFETAHRLDQYLELSVIGLDHVIEILHLPVGRLPVQLSFALQFGDRCTIARRFVGIERGRLFPVLQASQGLAQEPLRCLGAAGRRQVEIDRVAPLVDCPVQVGPLAPHLDVGFIQAPARIKATPPEPAQPLLHLRGVALDPAIDRRMVDRNAAFRQHFLKVAIADRIATIPAHRPQDHITLEMAPLEIRHRSVRPISAKHAQASRFLQQSRKYGDSTRWKMGERSSLSARSFTSFWVEVSFVAFGVLLAAARWRRTWAWPMASSIERKPSWAKYSRTSSAMKVKKLTTCSARPVNFLRRSGFWVAMPTGQISRWHTRIMMQPSTTKGAVAKPNSSAPNRAAMMTSRPVFNWPSHCTRIRSRNPLSSRVCWVSARPSSHGPPACLSEVSGDAPVPPSCPETSTTSACALETPAATVPMPCSATSLTWMRASGFAHLRS